jgi:hypothetical protein
MEVRLPPRPNGRKVHLVVSTGRGLAFVPIRANDTAALLSFSSGCVVPIVQLKKTPFSSCPSTETRFAFGLGGVSDWKWKPGCCADQVIVAPVLRNIPLNCCEVFSISAVAIAPSHFTSKDTLARTGKTPGMGGVGIPSPSVSALARS